MLQVSDWYAYIGLGISVIVSIIFPQNKNVKREDKAERGHNSDPSSQRKVPTSRKKQVKLAEDILSNIDLCISLANKSTNVSNFLDWYDEALEGLSTLMQLDKVKFKNPPSLDYHRIKDELQWHLCDAIVRAKEKAISDIKVTYKNSKDFQERTASSFEYSINNVSSRFSKNTKILADNAVREVKKAAGIVRESQEFDAYTTSSGTISSAGQCFDLMEGHDFERWCASLLEKNNFVDVNVTRGSGDQGVDILAEKDGIKYAIQCKCYSKDLGNGPIQEVETGKKIYGCHIGAVMTNRYFTSGAKEAAAATGILLWDRDWIISRMGSDK